MRVPVRAGLVVVLILAAATWACRSSFRSDRGAEAAVAPTAIPASAQGTLTIPKTHPRLWWTADRLARGRKWIKDHTERLRDDALMSTRALRYLLGGDRREGETAVNWLVGATIRTDGVASDDARWIGEEAMLVYDWCYDLLTSDQRKTLIDRWNGYIDVLNKKEWGGPGLEGNNYYWGYLRNGFEWGVVSYHENPKAPEFLEFAMTERYRRGFVPFANGPGRGAVLGEGTQYGPYIPAYATIPFSTAANLGVDLWNASNFFKEAVFYLIYATTPAPTTGLSGEARFEVFPFNDDEKWRYGGSAGLPELGMFMLAATEQWPTSPVGQYAQAWLSLVKPKIPDIGQASAGPPIKARNLADLPLDYFAPGAGFFYGRNKWGPDASAVHIQLGRPQHVGHEHIDWGNFQIWRAGRWLTRETVSYGEMIANWQGGKPTGGDQIAAATAIGHNLPLFEGMGARTVGHRRGPPHLIRLTSQPTYFHAAVDLSDSYRCERHCRKERDENEYAATVVRELVYLRPLETLVVLDRMEASDDRKSPKDVTKTFVLHSEPKPTVDGSGVLIQNGDQALKVWTLLPQKAVPRIVVEGGPVGQHRIEVDAKGSELSHLLHVMQARGAKDPNVGVMLYESETTATVALMHPTKGVAKVVFEKGAASKGGKIGWAKGGDPPLAPLPEQEQAVQFSDNGPAWR